MLPQKLPLELMQTSWASELNPVLANPLVQGQLLKSVSLVAGQNIVNHKLGRALQGWVVTRIRASATLYDQQDANKTPGLTLVLQASAPVVVDLYVF
jgi:hypothetical protein